LKGELFWPDEGPAEDILLPGRDFMFFNRNSKSIRVFFAIRFPLFFERAVSFFIPLL
jgi:hypothetical protein